MLWNVKNSAIKASSTRLPTASCKVKYLAKQTNTSTSLNTSVEKLQDSQQLWQCLTAGSQTVSVPVTTLPPALVNPPAPTTPSAEGGLQEPPVTQAAVEKMVREILEKQQGAMQPRQQQQQQLPKRTRNCLACGQTKSRYLGDGSSIHFFYQTGEVKYFYCSTKVFQTYAAEGLTNPRMPFQDFADTEFFQRELEASKQRGMERKRVLEERGKRKLRAERRKQMLTGKVEQGKRRKTIRTLLTLSLRMYDDTFVFSRLHFCILVTWLDVS